MQVEYVREQFRSIGDYVQFVDEKVLKALKQRVKPGEQAERTTRFLQEEAEHLRQITSGEMQQATQMSSNRSKLLLQSTAGV